MRRRYGWELPERLATPEQVFFGRRAFLRRAGLASIGALAAGCADAGGNGDPTLRKTEWRGLRGSAAIKQAMLRHPTVYPAERNRDFTLDRPVTDEQVAGGYNNFYEFKNEKHLLAERAAQLTLRPWTVEIAGLVEKPFRLDVDEIIERLPVEERLYRHRCVEAWAMAVPWTGIPMRAFIRMARPLSKARYVRFVSFHRPEEAIGQREDTHYKWPYYEGLRLDEANNELTLLVTGIYGKPLPPQHGAPIRIVTPWKYGYKSIKSIVRVEFVSKKPRTFWNDAQPLEYGFLSNVNPAVPHPRWSQATERMLGTDERRPTLPYNGYAEWVAGLYERG